MTGTVLPDCTLGHVYTETFWVQNGNFSLRMHLLFTQEHAKHYKKQFLIVNANLSGNITKTQRLKHCVNVKNGQNVIVEGAWIRWKCGG